MHHSLSVVSQRLIVRCYCLNIRRTHQGELRRESGWTDMTVTSGIDHQRVLFTCLGLVTAGRDLPIHTASPFLEVFHRENPQTTIKSEGASNFSDRVHLRHTRRMQGCVWWPRLFNLFARVAFTDFGDIGFRLARAFTFALRLVLLLVKTNSSLVTVFSTISALTIEARVFNFRFSVNFPM